MQLIRWLSLPFHGMSLQHFSIPSMISTLVFIKLFCSNYRRSATSDTRGGATDIFEKIERNLFDRNCKTTWLRLVRDALRVTALQRVLSRKSGHSHQPPPKKAAAAPAAPAIIRD